MNETAHNNDASRMPNITINLPPISLPTSKPLAGNQTPRRDFGNVYDSPVPKRARQMLSSSPPSGLMVGTDENLRSFIDWAIIYYQAETDEFEVAFDILKQQCIGVDVLKYADVQLLTQAGLAVGTAIKIVKGFFRWKRNIHSQD